jgi:hypothetical protein
MGSSKPWAGRAARRGSLVLLSALGLAQIVWGTIHPENGGLGFDGVRYARIAREPEAALAGSLDLYSAQRVVPSLTVRLLLALSGTTPGNEEVRMGFSALNLTLLLAAGAAWWTLSGEWVRSSVASWLGFCLLFFSLGSLRQPFYYSPLTDTSAFALGAALVVFHLHRSDIGMLLTLGLGALTWRSFLPLGVALFLFPRSPQSQPDRSRNSAWPAAAGAFLTCSIAIRAIAPSGSRIELFLGAATVTALLGAVIVDLLLGGGLRSLAAWRIPHRRLLLVLGLTGGVVLLIWAMARRQLETVGAGPTYVYPVGLFVIRDVIGRGILSPDGFFTNHLRFYGMTPLLVLVLWRPLCQAVHSLGPGMTIYLAVHLLMTPNPESRQLMDGHFAIVLAIAMAAAAARLKVRVVWMTAAFGLVSSTIWLPETWGGGAGTGELTLGWALRWLPESFASPSGRQTVLALVSLAAIAVTWLVGGRRFGRGGRS